MKKIINLVTTPIKKLYSNSHSNLFLGRWCIEDRDSLNNKNIQSYRQEDLINYKNFHCNQYVDITDFVQTKKKAMESYASYFQEQHVDTVINYNKYRGSKLGKDRVAETFCTMYNKL